MSLEYICILEKNIHESSIIGLSLVLQVSLSEINTLHSALFQWVAFIHTGRTENCPYHPLGDIFNL